MMYSAAVLEHARSPRNFGELANADVVVRDDNPLCGDEIALYLAFDSAGQLADVRFTGRGCALALASASLLTEQLRGRSLESLRQLDAAQLVAWLGVEVRPMRMKCVRLSLDVLHAGVAQHERATSAP